MKSVGPLFEALAPSVRAPERRIGRGPAPPPHRPTTAVPNGLLQKLDENVRRDITQKADGLVDRLRQHIGEPFYARDGFVLYNADCNAVLAAMARERLSIDLTVTSPPYNIGKDYEHNLPLDTYINWCREWLASVWELTSSTGSFWLNVGYFSVERKGRAVPISYLLWDQSPFFMQQEIVWHYGAGVTAKRGFAPRNEKWLFYTRHPDDFVFNLDDVRDPNVKYPNQKKNGKFRCNPLGKNPSDVWEFPKVTTGDRRSSRERAPHPAQFPLGVVDRIVKVSSNYCDIVLDPFSGSGSSGIAAVGNGRVYVGVELRKDYCQATVSRHEDYLSMLNAHLEQVELTLF